MSKKPEVEPTAVGRPPKRSQIREGLSNLSKVDAKSPLDLQIVRLLTLHPPLQVRFRNQDIASLDDATKRVLLEDINSVLGIRTLRKQKT